MIIESRERTATATASATEATASDTATEATASDTATEATASDTVNEATASATATASASATEATASDTEGGSGSGTVRVSNLYLIDLAGSERLAYSGSTGMRQKEGAWVAVARGWLWLDGCGTVAVAWMDVAVDVWLWLSGCGSVTVAQWFWNGEDWSSIERDRADCVVEGGDSGSGSGWQCDSGCGCGLDGCVAVADVFLAV
jgi:hypothetical protein